MFNFFKVVPLNKNINLKSKIISYCSNSTYKVLCNADDEVQVFWRDWECLTLQIKNLKLCCIPENCDNLILLSQHAITNKIVLSAYNIGTQAGRKNANLFSTSVLEGKSKVTALSAFNLSDFQILLSIGFDNGSILFSKSSVHKEMPASAFKYVSVTVKAVKGIQFLKNRGNISMFVCSDAGIFCYTISNNFKFSETKIILDDMDSSIHCIILTPTFELGGEQYLVIARDDGLYCYTADGRGPCYAVDGHKQAVEWFGKHLFIVLKTKESFPQHQMTSQLLIYDIDTKIIILNKEIEEVACLLPDLDRSNCLIILKNGEVLTLQEQEMKYKLSRLIKKNLYDIALRILEDYNANLDVISDILVQYGDYLLQRGDPSGAVINYSKTIGTIPPSVIINKIMEFRYNEFLIQYLSKLVETEYGSQEHLNLLNNCFRRINLPKNAFRVFEIEDSKLKQLCVDYTTINHNDNVTSIIKNLKQNQYFSPNFFHKLSNIEVAKFLSEYGYFLIKEYPNVLKELTKYSLSDQFLKDMFIRILLPLSLMNKLCALYFIDNLIKDCDKNVYNILTELILQMWFKGHIETNFVIDFFRSHQPEICIDSIFVLCRNYKFWPGIKMIYDKYRMEMLSNHCLAKCIECFPEYVNVYSQDYSSQKLNQIIQTIKKEDLTKTSTLKYTTDMVKYIIKSNPYYILNVLNCFAKCSDFLVSDLDEFLVKEQYLTYFKCDQLYEIVIFLENRVIYMEEVVNNYLRRPIEFRNRSCDICKQIIKQPSLYFLCQHSFHRECFKQFSDIFVCIVCTDRQKSKTKVNNTDWTYKNTHKSNDNHKNNMLLEISKKIGQLHFKCSANDLKSKTKQYSEDMETSNHIAKKIILKSFTCNEYDDNLNPFSNK